MNLNKNVTAKFSFKKAASFSFIFLLAGVWVSLFAAGEWMLLNYEKTPGVHAGAPSAWPEETVLKRSEGLAKLLVFVHPHCPCSRATLGELAILMSRCRGKVDAEIIFMKPTAAQKDWVSTDLWNTASKIPEARLRIDESGEMRRFGAMTSGQVLLYDGAGKLIFNGGITGSRGHSGDNAGRAAVEAFILEGRKVAEKTPVFGCFLRNRKLKFFQEVTDLWKSKPVFSFQKKE